MANKKFKGIRGLIAEAYDFRGGSKNKNFLEIRMAIALAALQDQRDAFEYEYFVMETATNKRFKGPYTEEAVDEFIKNREEEFMAEGIFYKGRRVVGSIESV